MTPQRRETDRNPPDVIMPDNCLAHLAMVERDNALENKMADRLKLLTWIIGITGGAIVAVMLSGVTALNGSITKQEEMLIKLSGQVSIISQQVNDYNTRTNARLEKLEDWQRDVRNWLETADKQQATREQVKRELNKPIKSFWSR